MCFFNLLFWFDCFSCSSKILCHFSSWNYNHRWKLEGPEASVCTCLNNFPLKTSEDQLLRWESWFVCISITFTRSLISLKESPDRCSKHIHVLLKYLTSIHRNEKSSKPHVSICQIQQLFSNLFRRPYRGQLWAEVRLPVSLCKGLLMQQSQSVCLLLRHLLPFLRLLWWKPFVPQSQAGT